MGIIRKVQNNFTTGIVSRGVLARMDLDKYASACLRLENAIVHPQGGISKRPGTKWVDTLENSGSTEEGYLAAQGDVRDTEGNTALMVPFQYGSNESYVLLFCERLIRIYYNGAPLMQDSEPLALETPYRLKDLKELKFVQSYDYIFLTHRDYAVRKLVRTSADQWDISVFDFGIQNPYVPASVTLAEPPNSGTKADDGHWWVTKKMGGGDLDDAVGFREVTYAVTSIDSNGAESSPRRSATIKIRNSWPEGAFINISWSHPGSQGGASVSGFPAQLGVELNGDYNLKKKEDGNPVHLARGNVHLLKRRFTVGGVDKYAWVFSTSGAEDSSCQGPGEEPDGSELAYTPLYAEGTLPPLDSAVLTWTGATTLVADGFPLSGDIDINGTYFYDTENKCYMREVEPESCIYIHKKKYKVGGASRYVWIVATTYKTGVAQRYPAASAAWELFCSDAVAMESGLPAVTACNWHGHDGQRNAWPTASDADVLPETEFSIVAGGAVTGAISLRAVVKRYVIYKNYNGKFGYIGSVGSDTDTFMDDNISPDYTQSFFTVNDPFGAEDGTGTAPSAVGIVQQRLFLAGSRNTPMTVWMSETGNLGSFNTHEPLIDSDSIEVTMDSRKISPIKHVVQLKETLLFTESSEYLLSAGERDGAISPKSLDFRLQSYWGCTDVPPLAVGDSVLFVTQNGRTVRDFQYKYTEDGYVGSDISVLASDLLSSDIKDWCVENAQTPMVWVCLEDGRLMSLTYLQEQEVYAWATHTSGGDAKFHSACAIHEQGRDYVYLLVERTKKLGNEHYLYFNRFTLERMSHWEYGDKVEESCFLDCAVDTPDGEVPFLPDCCRCQYLDGGRTKTIDFETMQGAGSYAILTKNGALFQGVPSKAVSNTYPNEYEYVLRQPAGLGDAEYTVGYPYTMVAETVNPEIATDTGAVIGDKRRLAEVSLMLRETCELKVGDAEDNLVAVKLPNPGAYSVPVPKFTGTVNVVLPGRFGDEARCVVKSELPYPCTVLCVASKIDIG